MQAVRKTNNRLMKDTQTERWGDRRGWGQSRQARRKTENGWTDRQMKGQAVRQTGGQKGEIRNSLCC